MADEWDDWDDDGGPSSEPASSAQLTQQQQQREECRDTTAVMEDPQRTRRIEKVKGELQGYLLDVVDRSVREDVNVALSKRCSSFAAFASYFEANSTALSKYTMETELKRMNFAVTKNGTTTSSSDDILDHYARQPLLGVWAAANQSIYADILQCMQQKYLRPELSISIVSDASSFAIDLDRNTLCARSNFVVVTTTRKRSELGPSGDSRREIFSKLELATFEATVTVDFASKKACQQIHSPNVKMVFDDALSEAAATILDLQQTTSPYEQQEDLITMEELRARLLATSELTTHNMSRVAERVRETSGSVLQGLVTGLGRFVGADRVRRDDDALADLLLRTRGALAEDSSLIAEPLLSPSHGSTSSSSSSSSEDADRTPSNKFRDLFSKLSIATGSGADDVAQVSFADFMEGHGDAALLTEETETDITTTLENTTTAAPTEAVAVQLRTRPKRN